MLYLGQAIKNFLPLIRKQDCKSKEENQKKQDQEVMGVNQIV